MTEPHAAAHAAADAAALWLAIQQRLAAQAAHDVKNALNGLAVNLEVVRARTARGGAPEQVAPFATTAAEQLEGAVALVEAVLALARPARAPADVGGVAGVVRGLAPLLAALGHPVTMEGGAAPVPAMDGDALRTLVAGALLAVADGLREPGGTGVADVAGGTGVAAGLRCAIEPDRTGGTRVHIAGARPAALSPALRRLADGAGVSLTPVPRGIELTIPALETA